MFKYDASVYVKHPIISELLCDWCDEKATNLMIPDNYKGVLKPNTINIDRTCDSHLEEYFQRVGIGDFIWELR